MNSTLKIILCALGLLTLLPVNATELGRLFFTPEQRTQLDYNYAREARPENNKHGLILNGIVQKHGGNRTAWINGVPQQAGNSDEQTTESMPVAVPGQSQPIKLKVGQRFLLNPSSSTEATQPNTTQPTPSNSD